MLFTILILCRCGDGGVDAGWWCMPCTCVLTFICFCYTICTFISVAAAAAAADVPGPVPCSWVSLVCFCVMKLLLLLLLLWEACAKPCDAWGFCCCCSMWFAISLNLGISDCCYCCWPPRLLAPFTVERINNTFPICSTECNGVIYW